SVGAGAGSAGGRDGAGRGQREQVRKKVAGLVHDLDPPLWVGYANVHMEPEDQDRADDVLHLLLEHLVPFLLGDELLLPVREGVRPGAGEAQTFRPQEAGQRGPQVGELFTRLLHGLADAGPNLDHRLDHLSPERVRDRLSLRGHQELVDVRVELAAGVDDLILLFDPDRQPLLAHVGPSTTNVGTMLPAPAVTFSSADELSLVKQPPGRPSKRYGSRSMARSSISTDSSATGKTSRGT